MAKKLCDTTAKSTYPVVSLIRYSVLRIDVEIT
jgi:hypothetical protein